MTFMQVQIAVQDILDVYRKYTYIETNFKGYLIVDEDGDRFTVNLSVNGASISKTYSWLELSSRLHCNIEGCLEDDIYDLYNKLMSHKED